MSIFADLISAGLSAIPVKADKRPLVPWAEYQTRLPTPEEYKACRAPVGVVCGQVSGGLQCLDFDDGGSAFKEWAKLVKEHMPNLPDRLVVQKTPSGGYHVVYRCPDNCIENRKLAQKVVDGKVTVLIETRGEGGYFLCDPSPGYKILRGELTNINTISVEEANNLMAYAVYFNEQDTYKEYTPPPSVTIERNGLSPLDDYDHKNTPIDLMLAYGWTIVQQSGDKISLCRPDKKGGISATWNHVPGRLYVFTTSTLFTAGTIYKPSAVYAILNHAGDWVAAAKQLRRDGYGDDPPEKKEIDYDMFPATTTVKASDFRESIYKFYDGERTSGFRLMLPQFDECLRLDRGYLNIVTGVPTHGKSEFVDFLSILLAQQYKWRFVVFSPENYPPAIHFNKLAEKYCRKNMWGAQRSEVDRAIEFVDEHYDFIDATEEDLCIETILGACLSIERPDCMIIDPWNEIELQRPPGTNDSDFTGVCLRKLRKFARKNNICIILVAHPAKMMRNKDSGKYPIPSMYDISGSANFYNKADNGIVVYRNFDENNVEVHIKKVKYKNYGQLGMVKFNYDVNTGLYTEVENEENAPWTDYSND